MKKGDILDLRITHYAVGGKGICKMPTEKGEFVLFVENTFPGQLVRARIAAKKPKYADCKLIEILERAPEEQKLPYQEISGAPYIFFPIALQESVKKEAALVIYQKFAGIDDIESRFDEFISSPVHFNYRNKMEYAFSCIEHDLETNEERDEAFALGSKRRGTWWKVENLKRESGLFDADWENKMCQIRDYLQQTGLPAWHPPRKEGFFRHLMVRKSFHQDQLLIHFVTSSYFMDQFDLTAFGRFVQELHGNRVAGMIHTINDSDSEWNKFIHGKSTLVFGRDKLLEELDGLIFEISLESFFQTNPASALQLYRKALTYVYEGNDLENKVVMDLFCGTGTIGQILAKNSPTTSVIGVDIVPEAIEDAKRNAERNGIDKITFFASDMGKFLIQYPQYVGKIGTIVLDPPRSGIMPKALQKIIELGADRIVYISCNPATHARDTQILIEAGYELEKLSLVDQFPHTSHLEAIAKFVKKSQPNGEA